MCGMKIIISTSYGCCKNQIGIYTHTHRGDTYTYKVLRRAHGVVSNSITLTCYFISSNYYAPSSSPSPSPSPSLSPSRLLPAKTVETLVPVHCFSFIQPMQSPKSHYLTSPPTMLMKLLLPKSDLTYLLPSPKGFFGSFN